MYANVRELILKAEVFEVVGCAMEVLNALGQIMNYLKITGLKVGLILNFRRSNLEWRRIVLERDRE